MSDGDLLSELFTPAPAIPKAGQIISEPGIYAMSNDDYHADPCIEPSLSRGTISDLINLTPAHAFFNHPSLGTSAEEEAEEEAETKFDLGSAWHSLLFEGVQAAEVIDPKDYPGPKGGIPKGWTTDLIRAVRDKARANGKIPFLPKQYQKTIEMVEAAKKFLAESEFKIKDIQAEGKSEQTIIWKEGDTWFRVRPDWISNKNYGDRRLMLDGKSVAQSADPDRFKPSEHGKDIQHSLYRRGYAAVTGEKRPKFVFLVQETAKPYLCSLVSLDPQTISMAEEKIKYGIFMWEKCRATGEWPGYPNQVCEVESKPWEIASWEYKKDLIGVE